MNIKNIQPYISNNELGSREEMEVHEQRIKALEEYNEKNKSSRYKIINFITILIFILTILVFLIIQPDEK